MVAIEALLQQCAPQVSFVLMEALVRAESAWRPLAVGLDKPVGRVKQPATLEEAVAAAKALDAAGRGFSVGLAQIHVSNVHLYGLTWEQAFDPCQNLAVGQKILWRFFHRASASGYLGVAAVWAALRGYNSGGINRSVSDEYANRVFTYMGLAPKLPEKAPESSTATAHLVDGASLASLKASEDTSTARRPEDSPDIFERGKAKDGF